MADLPPPAVPAFSLAHGCHTHRPPAGTCLQKSTWPASCESTKGAQRQRWEPASRSFQFLALGRSRPGLLAPFLPLPAPAPSNMSLPPPEPGVRLQALVVKAKAISQPVVLHGGPTADLLSSPCPPDRPLVECHLHLQPLPAESHFLPGCLPTGRG